MRDKQFRHASDNEVFAIHFTVCTKLHLSIQTFCKYLFLYNTTYCMRFDCKDTTFFRYTQEMQKENRHNGRF